MGRAPETILRRPLLPIGSIDPSMPSVNLARRASPLVIPWPLHANQPHETARSQTIFLATVIVAAIGLAALITGCPLMDSRDCELTDSEHPIAAMRCA